ncbi:MULTISPECIES: site-specific integrase [unclassified Nitratiruptor]|uniref:tyrosine-type recombinase/integrase n=1 Tax=unclassified Nitratiruptor TaxID=2624044 RepID=UPI001915C501|nr:MULTISPECIES: site-specific integrase [unclassified Nitratiruptor]BCD60031.1 hypothetical protein NitYY0810_C0794 [Nitratiruptor sp. YY08-10]BCD63953.1 hypothetical protein NitYY0814_C0792 [Nitratiruptor sp. YY08-14]BCD64478.1 hypothetical protein NitYY0814_C1325 [Nitratiruptor sp. YY08-14]
MTLNTDHTLNDLFNLYLELYSSSRAPHTITTKKSMWKNYVKNDIGAKKCASLSFIDYQKFFNKLLKKLAPKTVKNIKHDVQAVVNIAVRLGIMQENPLKYVELPQFDNKVYFNYPPEVMQKIFQCIIDHDEIIYRNIFIFLAHGRRLNEALSLQWRHVDLPGQLYVIPARINKAKKDMQYQMTNLLRSVFLFQRDLAIKFDYLEMNSYVFFNPNTMDRYKDIRKAWKRFLSKYDLPKIRLHDIRHLVGTYSINVLNLPIEKVSYALGHTNITTTQRYVTQRPKSAKEVVDSIISSLKEFQ